MENTTEKKLPARNWERIDDKKFYSYEAAKDHQKKITDGVKSPITVNGKPLNLKSDDLKVKVFARNDNSFDVVVYQSVASKRAGEVTLKKAEEDFVATVKELAPKHGLKAKDRRKKDKKSRTA
jgi:hypothetical protein